MIWVNGISIGGGPVISNHVQVKVVLDFDKCLIKWFEEDEQIGGMAIG